MNTQDEHLDYILDRCIERIASGESVSSCLASYPDDREELEPLLRIAAVTMQGRVRGEAQPGGEGPGSADAE